MVGELRLPPAGTAMRTVKLVETSGDKADYAARDIDRITLASGQRYASVLVKLPADPEGIRRQEMRLARVLFAGGLRLLRAELDLHEYNREIRGMKGYYYLIHDGENWYQLDLFQSIGRAGDYSVSRRYRNVLKYLAKTCEAAAKVAEKAGFTDYDFVRFATALDAYEHPGAPADYIVDLPPPAKNYQGIEAGTLLLGGVDVHSLGLSFGGGYHGDYGIYRNGRLRFQVGLGVARHHYRTDRERDIRQMMLYGHFMLAYELAATGTVIPSLSVGYSIYNNLGAGNSQEARMRGRLGYPSARMAIRYGATGAFVSIHANRAERIIYGPKSILNLGLFRRL